MGIGDRFAALSLHDLLEAREAYHVHLLRQRNVVATAVGRYLMRIGDDDARSFAERRHEPPGRKPPRTLDQVEVTPRSWPCVIVFVDEWMDADEIHDAPDEMVPRALYLPDGRVVPTCVVYARPESAAERLAPQLSFPGRVLGGGYACLSTVQGRDRAGSIGCLVSDGLKTYALTNRHVAGEPGTQQHTLIGETPVAIGVGAARSAGRIPFEQAYPGMPGARAEATVDAGLIELDDVQRWTTQVFGVGSLSEMLDVSPESLGLDLIGTPVRAFGAASGPLTGQLLALFHRYRARSGVEHVADAVVGPRSGDGPLHTRPGDSGTLWVVDRESAKPLTHAADAPPVQPLALQWGGAHLADEHADGGGPYALVTFLSTACRALDVEPLFDWNAGWELYWSEVGHYTIGALACDLVAPDALRDFFVANRRWIAFDVQAILDDRIDTGNPTNPQDRTPFFPLSDVPDRVWRSFRRDREFEGPNHFADMDEPLDDDPDTTLMRMFELDPASLAPDAWLDWYEQKRTDPRNMGSVPFRVAQLYRIAVAALRANDVDTAFAAAGVMAHYVGDACQPLHASRLHDGATRAERGVHSAYEKDMVNLHRDELIEGLRTMLAGVQPLATTRGGEAAARAVVELMQRTICDAWSSRHDADGMWAELGEQTIACIADGCRTLAGIWSSIWEEAGTPAPPPQLLDGDRLRARYLDKDFARSLFLPELARELQPWAEAPVPVA